MKLIEFLISESKKGWEWPGAIVKATSTKGGRGVNFYFDYAFPPILSNTLIAPVPFSCSELVTREQYESALAASKPEWNGEGIPPVGTVCEYTKQSLTVKEWTECTIDYVGSSFIVYRDCYGVELTGIKGDIKFRPVRSEADKKKEEAVFAIAELCRDSASNGHSAELIYDAIKSGKIVID
ncbi:TPA: hypothetical protein QHR04_002189 [Enterobacter kobei]|nr:hypothetical protein [Enterobacter kobei]